MSINEENRISEHPILGKTKIRREMNFFFNGKCIKAYEGDTIASALLAEGIKIFRYSNKYKTPRGIFCAIGHCTDCAMKVDGIENIKTCVTLVKDGMIVSN